MNSVPLVSVVIPAYNMQKYIRESVDSALAQTHPRMEIVVVNDGSTDETAAILKSYGDRIIYIEHTNRGLSATRNVGVRATSGDYVAFLDADDCWLPEKTTRQLEVFARSERIGLVTTQIHIIDEDSVRLSEESAEGFTTLHELGTGEEQLKGLLVGNTVGTPSAVMVSRACLDRVGLFDEDLLNGSEDWDFHLRVAYEGIEIARVEERLTEYRVTAQQMSGAANVDRMLNNNKIVLRKIYNRPKLKSAWLSRGRSYSYCHLVASWGLLGRGDERLNDLRRWVLASFLYYPPAFFTQANVALMLRAALGEARTERVKTLIKQFR